MFRAWGFGCRLSGVGMCRAILNGVDGRGYGI